jgi:hypothetical protein
MDVDHRDQNPATDDFYTAERLHGGMYDLACLLIEWLTALIDTRDCLDRHRVGDGR